MNTRLRPLHIFTSVLLWLGSVAASHGMGLGSNFWDLRWHSADDCFKDVKAVAGENPWNPQFLEDLKIYNTLRFMDWDSTNGSERSKWTERVRKDAPKQTTVAYEWMIDLCNRMQTDMWVCIPHQTVNRNQGNAPADYALRLAVLIRTGVDMGEVDLAPLLDKLAKMDADALIAAGGVRTSEPLNPKLKVYFEYSNETWNGQFKQSHYCAAEGTALNLHDGGKVDDKGVSWTAGFRFHAWAALRVFRAADLVFGADNPRVVKVFASHIANSFVTSQHMTVLKDPRWNPWGVKANAVAVAPYFGHKVSGDDPDVVAKLREAIAQVGASSAKHLAITKENGLSLITYEGGQHVIKKAAAINASPAMYDLYKEYLAEMSKYYTEFVHYAHVGKRGDKGAWGAMEKTGQDLANAPKMRALVEFSKANNHR